MTDDEIKTLATLLHPYRSKVEAHWDRRHPHPRADASEPTDLLTLPEAAAILGVKSSKTVHAFIAKGELAAVDIATRGGRAKTRIRRDHLQQFIENRTRTAPR